MRKMAFVKALAMAQIVILSIPEASSKKKTFAPTREVGAYGKVGAYAV
jgi:hypothetical protein